MIPQGGERRGGEGVSISYTVFREVREEEKEEVSR